jgi:pimeloyl-ACP methyl ester carboxylesterase
MPGGFRKFFNILTEAQRAAVEWGGMHIGWPYVRDRLPQGDGHPVLFFPGFLTTDGYTSSLRERATEAGFKTYSWEGGFNLGLDAETAEHVARRLHEVYAENGGRKVSLVGYSLGGLYARELAREFPDMVRSVVTLGTPFGRMDDTSQASPLPVDKIIRFFTRDSVHDAQADIGARCLTPPPVPTTSIYSLNDGVAEWQASLNPKAKQAENIEVYGSHLGMTVNPLTIAVVIDRLAQPEGGWKKFSPHPDFTRAYPEARKTDLPKNPRWSLKGKKDARIFGMQQANGRKSKDTPQP